MNSASFDLCTSFTFFSDISISSTKIIDNKSIEEKLDPESNQIIVNTQIVSNNQTVINNENNKIIYIDAILKKIQNINQYEIYNISTDQEVVCRTPVKSLVTDKESENIQIQTSPANETLSKSIIEKSHNISIKDASHYPTIENNTIEVTCFENNLLEEYIPIRKKK